MRLEKILLSAIIILLILSAVIPFIIFHIIKDKAIAAQIGDTFGGTTAPIINVCAILAVITTYLYQRRNDQRNNNKEQIFRSFQNLKEELLKLDHVVTIHKGNEKEVKHYVGAEAIHEMIRALNNGEYSHIDLRELIPFKSILNVYQYLNLLLTDLKDDSALTPNDKKMLLTQLSLFYRNNLLIDKEQRGDEICQYHRVKHIIPSEIYNQLVEIESKIR